MRRNHEKSRPFSKGARLARLAAEATSLSVLARETFAAEETAQDFARRWESRRLRWAKKFLWRRRG